MKLRTLLSFVLLQTGKRNNYFTGTTKENLIGRISLYLRFFNLFFNAYMQPKPPLLLAVLSRSQILTALTTLKTSLQATSMTMVATAVMVAMVAMATGTGAPVSITICFQLRYLRSRDCFSCFSDSSNFPPLSQPSMTGAWTRTGNLMTASTMKASHPISVTVCLLSILNKTYLLKFLLRTIKR